MLKMRSSALVIALAMGVCAAAYAADSATSSAPSSGDSQGNGLEDSIPLGPFKLNGGVIDSQLGTTLTGGYSQKIIDFTHGHGCTSTVALTADCQTKLLNINASVDASLKSGSDPQNHATIILQPTFEFSSFSMGPFPQKPATPDADCGDVPKSAKDDPADNSFWKKDSCHSWIKGAAVHQSWASWAVYPDLEYRDGTVTAGGKEYDADQILYGGGARYMLPKWTGSIFASWPYLSVGYDAVHNYGHTKAPAPTGVQDRYLTAETQVEFFIPGTKSLLHSDYNSIFLAKINTSHPTAGGSHGWEFSKEFELLIDVGMKLKPAISYQSGTDKGFSFDNQWLVGLVFPFLNRQDSAPQKSVLAAPSASAAVY